MSDRETKPLNPYAGAGAVVCVLSLVAWLWDGDWRWALSGAAFLLVGVIVGATMEGRR